MNDAINFLFAGDLTLGGEFIPYATKNNYEVLHPFKLIKPYTDDADIFFVNLEGPIFEGPERRPDVTVTLSNHLSVLKLLKNSTICVVNLANNHTLDYGEKGLKETIKLLQQSGIYYVGAGINEEEANRELIIQHKGKRIGFLAYTSNEPHIGAILAGPLQAGCASYLEPEKVIKKIQSLKTKTDLICVSLHWGYEYFLYPSNEQVSIAHALIDAGAHYVIGHHPHVIQGVEKYRNSLILYSLGNFFMPPIRAVSGRLQPTKLISKKFLLVNSEINQSCNLNYSLIGGRVNDNYMITPFENHNQAICNSEIEKLSAPLDLNNYIDFWLNYKSKREKELKKESFIEAYRKAFMMSFKELIRTITFRDIKRNAIRLMNILLRFK